MTATEHPSCECCGNPMTVGQQRRHYSCQDVGACTCRDDFEAYRDWVEQNVAPVLGPHVTPTPCELHGVAT